ncbi:conserved hypothetical protein, partial [Ricinus communis]
PPTRRPRAPGTSAPRSRRLRLDLPRALRIHRTNRLDEHLERGRAGKHQHRVRNADHLLRAFEDQVDGVPHGPSAALRLVHHQLVETFGAHLSDLQQILIAPVARRRDDADEVARQQRPRHVGRRRVGRRIVRIIDDDRHPRHDLQVGKARRHQGRRRRQRIGDIEASKAAEGHRHALHAQQLDLARTHRRPRRGCRDDRLHLRQVLDGLDAVQPQVVLGHVQHHADVAAVEGKPP